MVVGCFHHRQPPEAWARRLHDAKVAGAPQVTVCGSGRPRREFLHVDDLADLVRAVVGYPGDIVYDAAKPDGTPRKLLDVSRITEAGWTARTPLRAGVEATYRWFVEAEGRRG